MLEVLNTGVGQIAALLVSLTVIGGTLRKMMRSFRHLAEMAEFISTQMVNNGGSSMRDAIDRIGASLGELHERVDALERPKTSRTRATD